MTAFPVRMVFELTLTQQSSFTPYSIHSALRPSGNYFAAKVSVRHNPANAGRPPEVSRGNLPLLRWRRAYFPVQPCPVAPCRPFHAEK